MFMRLKNTNDIAKYCSIATCMKDNAQKDLKRIDTPTNTTKLSKAMRYAQYVRGTATQVNLTPFVTGTGVVYRGRLPPTV